MFSIINGMKFGATSMKWKFVDDDELSPMSSTHFDAEELQQFRKHAEFQRKEKVRKQRKHLERLSVNYVTVRCYSDYQEISC